MEIGSSKPSFKGIKWGHIYPIHTIYLSDRSYLESLASGVDVFIKSAVKNFPYRKSQVPISSIKVTARPQNLGFWEKLLNKKTVTEYFPTGNWCEIIGYKEPFETVFNRVISQVKK